jgi:hypothetical protein
MHCQSIVQALEGRFDVRVIAPRPKQVQAKESNLAIFPVLLDWISNLFRQTFLKHSTGKGRGQSVPTRAIVASGFFAGSVGLLWARLRRIPLVYYVPDPPEAVSMQFHDLAPGNARRIEWLVVRIERMIMRRANIVMIPSSTMEKYVLGEGVAGDNILVFPRLHEEPKLSLANVQRWQKQLGLQDRVGVVFVGSLDHPPNMRSFQFIRNVLAPRLQEAVPQARLIIAGRGSEGLTADLPRNMSVLGPVEDLEGLLFACSVGIAPMDVKGGTSNKIIDYLLHGLQVTATIEAAEGVISSPNLKISDEDGFASAVCSQVLGAERGSDAETKRSPDPAYLENYVRSKAPKQLTDKLGLLIRSGNGGSPRLSREVQGP